MFVLYSPHQKKYVGDYCHAKWVDWAKEGKEFPSMQDAKDYIFWQDWRDSTNASDPLAVYAVELVG